MATGNLTFPIRHAGQYYDAEVNLFYNYFRDYDPITGRYVESDPIGLDGGLNTYGYVGSNPLSLVDPKGLAMLFPALGFSETANWVLAIGLISSLPDSSSDNIGKQQCEQNCPPCRPYPVGTIGYQGPKTSTRGMHGTRSGTGEEHYILFEVQQNPRNCECRWQENKKIAGHHYTNQPNLFMTVNLNGKSRPPAYP